MNYRKYWILPLSLFIIALLIHFFSLDHQRVETWYSTGFYPYLSAFLRKLFGWLPFSIGDIVYGIVFIWLLYRLVIAIRGFSRKKFTKHVAISITRRTVTKLLLIYIIFNVLWGINYNRKGISQQLGLKIDTYNVEDVKTVNAYLLNKVNQTKAYLDSNKITALSRKAIFAGAGESYKLLSKEYDYLSYSTPSVKSSIWGWLGNYTGFLGYYNPFTAEAQINTTVPAFLQPYTTCHEMAHQLGYAKENEANFVGYLAAAASTDETFHYSVYLDLFLYANRNLYRADSTEARQYTRQLLPAVKADLLEWRKFDEKHRNPGEPVVRWLYGKYLESNQQPNGVMTYDEVTGFLIAYYKKFGRL